MSGHTPGPWIVGYRAFDVTAAHGQMKVCDIRGWGYLTGKGALGLSHEAGVAIQTANARLIAAAPDMLEALIALNADARATNWDDDDDPECAAAWRMLEAAITKATTTQAGGGRL